METDFLSILMKERAVDMSFRDYLVAQALGALLAHGDARHDMQGTAQRAIACADAVLLALANGYKEVAK
ncbi:MAG: hypothetical protein ABSC94_18295 [Polyangiaceae bacterium]